MTDRRIEYLVDDSKSIVAENGSPDIPFRFSLNPYRGCVHACAYCYARPTHEYLGLNAGLDFETRIIIKPKAAELFRQFLSRPAWHPEPITFSGVTDCYQPAERRFRLTRQCLETADEFGQPVTVVTKNALVLRDLDLLRRMARRDLVHVFVSLTTLDVSLAREMEPRTSIPAARLRAIRELAEAGVPVGVMTAPIIPGLNDSELAAVLEAARKAGATAAGYVLLRLPGAVAPVFEEWIRRVFPEKADRVLNRIRGTRDGKTNSSQFGERMVGSGEIAEQLRSMFHLFRRRSGLDGRLPPLSTDHFCRPDGQLRLF